MTINVDKSGSSIFRTIVGIELQYKPQTVMHRMGQLKTSLVSNVNIYKNLHPVIVVWLKFVKVMPVCHMYLFIFYTLFW